MLLKIEVLSLKTLVGQQSTPHSIQIYITVKKAITQPEICYSASILNEARQTHAGRPSPILGHEKITSSLHILTVFRKIESRPNSKSRRYAMR